MYLNIKAYSQKSYEEFYNIIKGEKLFSKNNIIFDILYFENTQITFYSNLTILFKGLISIKLENLIDTIIDSTLYVGSDEVGVGESVGPIVSTALHFNSYKDKKIVIMNGIKDSKKMTAKEIQEKSEFIKMHSEFYTAIMIPKLFNKTYETLSNVKAINAIMQNELQKKFEGRGYTHITDQFVSEKKYDEYILKSGNEAFKGKLNLLIKAEDKYLEVSAAAIISKSIFNNWLIKELLKDGHKVIIDKRLNSWDLFQKINSGEIKIKDKYKYIKNW